MAAPDKRDPAARQPNGRFGKGNTANPGGRPRKLVEIERMLDAEHRTVEKMRETFDLLRDIAHGVDEPVFQQGMVCGYKRKYDAAFMELYLNRVLGPVRELDIDLSTASPETLQWLAESGLVN